jgi:hypothetical protein
MEMVLIYEKYSLEQSDFSIANELLKVARANKLEEDLKTVALKHDLRSIELSKELVPQLFSSLKKIATSYDIALPIIILKEGAECGITDDTKTLSLGFSLFQYYTDEEVEFVIAHELAALIL